MVWMHCCEDLVREVRRGSECVNEVRGGRSDSSGIGAPVPDLDEFGRTRSDVRVI